MLDVMKSCRDIKSLNPLCQVLLVIALSEIESESINGLVTETYRPKTRQAYLYCLGRTVSQAMQKGISRKFAEKYCDTSVGEKTWTLNSIHILKNAVDLIPQRKVDGKMTAIYNAKDVQTIRIIQIMTKYGFEAGANWKTSVDSPHFQIKGVSMSGATFSKTNTNEYITKMIQTALNKKLGIHLVVDGDWGDLTTCAVDKFRKKQGWGKTGKLGRVALKRLVSNL